MDGSAGCAKTGVAHPISVYVPCSAVVIFFRPMYIATLTPSPTMMPFGGLLLTLIGTQFKDGWPRRYLGVSVSITKLTLKK
jgi:hypothetical protein